MSLIGQRNETKLNLCNVDNSVCRPIDAYLYRCNKTGRNLVAFISS